MSLSETGFMGIYLSVLKIVAREPKLKTLNIFLYFWFSWPRVNLSNTFLRGLLGNATISYSIDFSVL
jgi:hypothetical protein